MSIIYPRPLEKGDTVAIASPASSIDPTLVTGAAAALRLAGYTVKIMPHAFEKHGSFAATADERFNDLANALCDREVRAILCSRGGYGSVHLLDRLAELPLEADPKWVVGFSDISALHALLSSRGIVSVHGSMAKALAQNPLTFAPNEALLSIFEGADAKVECPANAFNRPGSAEGRLVGGNLAVVQALISTPYDVFKPGVILFIEDVAEPIYKVERIMWQLKMSGVLESISGFVIGQFTDYKPSLDHPDMYEMLQQFTSHLSVPVAYNAPIGHVDGNMPVLYGANAQLEVSADGATLTMAGAARSLR